MSGVTLYQMKAWDRLQAALAAKKLKDERQAQVMAAMKKPAQQQTPLRLTTPK